MPRINGTRFDDELAATSTTREALYGRDGDDTLIFYSSDFSDRFWGHAGDDVLEGPNFSFQGAESYSFTRNLHFSGGAGLDTIELDIEIDTDATTTLRLGTFAMDRVSAEIRHFDLDAAGSGDSTDTLTIQGSRRNEEVELVDTTGSGAGEIIVNLGGGNDLFNAYGINSNWASLRVNAGSGDDEVYLNQSADGARINTGRGDDIVYTNGFHRETIILGGGDDNVVVSEGSFNTQPDLIRTGGGHDRIHLSVSTFSTLAQITDFSEGKDTLVFSEAFEGRVFFDDEPITSIFRPVLIMDNEEGVLRVGDNVLVDFGGSTNLTIDNFEFSDSLL
ncbi:hypothetical protein PXK01_16525 [Phaeobacter sp. PT47_59]|uniref:hypothetical protein n=1 Tax=Phaeobacter sp. PT47_59 TaxID=3029979 RepID=UPI00238055AE|nr:hypothetical protein [Phaeobacter sp. PT47_59]MDE4175769.1 hypothetical protein [Phaeobacter sp. PT47_59]